MCLQQAAVPTRRWACSLPQYSPGVTGCDGTCCLGADRAVSIPGLLPFRDSHPFTFPDHCGKGEAAGFVLLKAGALEINYLHSFFRCWCMGDHIHAEKSVSCTPFIAWQGASDTLSSLLLFYLMGKRHILHPSRSCRFSVLPCLASRALSYSK